MSEELARWLGEQLDTDARQITDPYQATSWHTKSCEAVPDVLYPDRETGACDCGVPARMLREIDAKRQVVERYAWLREHGDTGGTAWVLPLLALPYADRPGYREDWKP